MIKERRGRAGLRIWGGRRMRGGMVISGREAKE
jgi:hypothetical protein